MTDLPLEQEDVLMCEEPGCQEVATTEWAHGDEDRHLYYTYRCDDHPAPDPSLPHPVDTPESMSLILGNNGSELRYVGDVGEVA